MIQRIYPLAATLISFVGVCFSGLLSARRYFANVCTFDETCATFSGIPACYIGFGFFLTLFGVALGALRRRIEVDNAAFVSASLSFLGVVFAIVASANEFHAWWSGSNRYALGAPTCVYGGLFFAAIFALSIAVLTRWPTTSARPLA